LSTIVNAECVFGRGLVHLFTLCLFLFLLDSWDMADEESTQAGKEQQHSPEVTTRRSTLSAILLVATCTLPMILNTASSQSASIALPTIGRELNIVEYKLQWIISAFGLSSGCLLLLFGRLADLYGRKLMFLTGCAVISIFSLAVGFSQNEITIDVLRAIQGVGVAATIPSALGVLAHSFPPSRARTIAFATFAAGAPLGGALGNVIGGTLTQLTAPKWRSSFYLLAGLGLATFVSGIFTIDKDVVYKDIDRRVDWLGAFLVTAGLVFICFILADGPIAPNTWGTSYIIALLVLGVALIVVFLLWQRYLERVHEDPEKSQAWWTPPPLMKVSIWTRSKGRMSVILLVAFFEWCSFQSFLFWAQLYYQNYLLLSPILTMVRFIPQSVTGLICNFLVAVSVSQVPAVYLIVLGTLSTATANLLFAVIRTSAPYWTFGFPAAVISVFGADFVFASGTLFVAKISLPHEQSLAGALFQTMTQLGTSFGLAITTIIFNSVLKKESRRVGIEVNLSGTNAPRFAQLKAYRAAMWGGFAFGVFGALLAAVFLMSVGIVGHTSIDDATLADDEKPGEQLDEKAPNSQLGDGASEEKR